MEAAISMNIPRLLLALTCTPLALSFAGKSLQYRTHHLTKTFYAEGAAAGDINGDGKMDIVYGPHWYAGPDWKVAHEIYSPEAYEPDNKYSKNFLAYTHDLNEDGALDYMVLGFPGDVAYWFENPKGKPGPWARHDVLKVLDNESPAFGDITGDGKPEIIGSSGGFFGFAEPNWGDATKEWNFRRISEKNVAGGRFTHGLGFGDVNNDNRIDLLEKNGWWEQPEDARLEWIRHELPLTPRGGSQMYAYDFDGDGDNDILTSLDGHGYGLTMFENLNTKLDFKTLPIMGVKPEDNAHQVSFSQLHAMDLADMNNDGVKDIITGKRYFAHGSKGDAEPLAPPVLYWFEVQPGKKSGIVKFIPHFIDHESGVGTQVTAVDMNGDGLKDVLVGNKLGCHVSIAKQVETDAEGFESIFDGKTLNGWEGAEDRWVVEDGAIVGINTAEKPLKENTFLMWRDGKVADFELRLKFRLTGPVEANSGIQFRCQEQPNYIVYGYQADMDRGGKYLGCLWDEHGRSMLADRGTVSSWDAKAQKTEQREQERDAAVSHVKMDDWNEYTIIAKHRTITLKLNGKVTAVLHDHDAKDSELYGSLALQCHSGPPMKIEFKDIRIKRDTP
jgi:hypothetical protein